MFIKVKFKRERNTGKEHTCMLMEIIIMDSGKKDYKMGRGNINTIKEIFMKGSGLKDKNKVKAN